MLLFADNMLLLLHIYTVMARINPALASHCPISSLFANPPCVAHFFTWRTSFLDRGANTHPLFSLVCYRLLTLCCFTQPDSPHRSSYNIYRDDINNISRPVWYTYSHLGYKKTHAPASCLFCPPPFGQCWSSSATHLPHPVPGAPFFRIHTHESGNMEFKVSALEGRITFSRRNRMDII